MPRLQADADPNLWVPVTESLGFRGRRHRKAAIRMLLSQAGSALRGPAGEESRRALDGTATTGPRPGAASRPGR